MRVALEFLSKIFGLLSAEECVGCAGFGCQTSSSAAFGCQWVLCRFRVPMVPGLHYGFHTDLVGELAKFDKVTYKGGQVMLHVGLNNA